MNEFIVWDDIEKDFVTNIDLDDLELYNKGYSITFILGFSAHLQAFTYIGKTDDTPSQNKIYADSSIVQFEYKGEIHNGYFVWCEKHLGYKIELFTGLTRRLISEIKNLKVIGTLQQVNHLLEDNHGN